MDVCTLLADNGFILEKSLVITLAELQDMKIFKKVTMSIKVVEVKDPVEFTSRTKQDAIITDSTTIAKVTLWVKHKKTLAAGKSCLLQHFVIQVFQLKNTLHEERIVYHPGHWNSGPRHKRGQDHFAKCHCDQCAGTRLLQNMSEM